MPNRAGWSFRPLAMLAGQPIRLGESSILFCLWSEPRAPFRASTLANRPYLLRLTLRCPNCLDAWEINVRPETVFRPANSTLRAPLASHHEAWPEIRKNSHREVKRMAAHPTASERLCRRCKARRVSLRHFLGRPTSWRDAAPDALSRVLRPMER